MSPDQPVPPPPAAPPSQASVLSSHAAAMVELLTNSSALTTLQMASVFRIAAELCEQTHGMAEREYMQQTLRRMWRK